MFAGRYYAIRFYPGRYFPEHGAALPTSVRALAGRTRAVRFAGRARVNVFAGRDT